MKASDVAGLMFKSCSEVLEAMYFTTVEGATHESSPALPGDYAADLTFAGVISGRFGVRLSGPSAQTLAANFLGEEETNLSAKEIGEVVGELANMLCGSVVSRIRSERTFVLSHPRLVEESIPEAEVEDLFVERLDTDNGVITAWVVVDRNASSL